MLQAAPALAAELNELTSSEGMDCSSDPVAADAHVISALRASDMIGHTAACC